VVVPSPFFLCTCRAIGAVIAGALAALGLSSGLVGPLPLDPGQIALTSLLAVTAVWLGFGIRTRAVAPLAAALALGFVFLALPEAVPARGPQVLALLLLALVVPLAAHGGGHACMLRKGWAHGL
jgi:hypothetical protein